MSKRIVSYCLTALLLNLFCLTSVAVGSPAKSKEDEQVDKLRAEIMRLGTGPDARIKVKLRDKTKVSGYVGEAGEDSFVVVDSKTGQPTRIPYPQVGQVKANNFSTGQKIVIGIATGVAVFLSVELIRIGRN